MDFVTVRELRAESGKVWDKVEAGEEMVITRNGKPFALLLNTQPDELEETLRVIRQKRFERLLAKQHQHAISEGLNAMPMTEINAEIAAMRQQRRHHRAGRR